MVLPEVIDTNTDLYRTSYLQLSLIPSKTLFTTLQPLWTTSLIPPNRHTSQLNMVNLSSQPSSSHSNNGQELDLMDPKSVAEYIKAK